MTLDRPATVTVDGAGLAEWAARTDVHIFRMKCEKQNGRYELSLLWLDGRKLYFDKSLPVK